MQLLKLKIGRHTYNITDKDQFMDNGHVVTLLTQSNENFVNGYRPDPRLSKRAIKEVSLFKRIKLGGIFFKLEKFPTTITLINKKVKI